MFDVSWGEVAVVAGLGLFLVGRHDLPAAARVVGTQVGRFVGLLQGARARADRFAAHHELRQLQNELRAGLRELDAVKSEVALSMSSRGMVGRGLGATVAGVDRKGVVPGYDRQQMSGLEGQPSSTTMMNSTERADLSEANSVPASLSSSSAHSMIGAVAEEEWKKIGIDFTSRAEQGSGLNYKNVEQTGSATLAAYLRNSLIFDQYDRVVHEQDQILQSKIDSIFLKKSSKPKEGDETEPDTNQK
jgi:Sec-independent protein translocase protein TatA